MMTNYGDKWLGHPFLDPGPAGAQPPQRHRLYPSNDANCCVNLMQTCDRPPSNGNELHRSIADLIFSGTAQKYPDIYT